MKTATAALTSSLGLVIGSLHAQTVPPYINYQGRVTDSNGVGLGTGTPVNRKVIFRIFDAATGGNRLWSEQHTVTISNGEFSVLLGNGIDAVYNGSTETPTKTATPLDTVFTSAGILRYVEILVDNGDNTINTSDAPIAPRQQITSTAYSFRARSADTIASGTDMQLNGSANYGLGYYGSGRLFNGATVDGPVLYGQSGGALGSVNGSTKNIALRWNAAGAVGVGSADLSGAAATTKLVLQGDDTNTAPLQLNIRGNSDVNKRLLLGYNTNSNYGAIQTYTGANSTGSLFLNPAGGNVGIGTTTAGSALTVAGNASVSGDVGAARILAPTATFSGDLNAGKLITPTIVASGDVSAGRFIAPTANLTGELWVKRISADGSGGYSFATGDSDGGIFSPADGTIVIRTDNTEKVRVTPSGSVGIGATAPLTTLDIRSATPAITVGTPGATGGALYLGNPNHGVRRSYGVAANSNDVGLYTTNADIYLSSQGDSVTTAFVLKNSGNVGIGTSNPAAPLDVLSRVSLGITRLGYVMNSGFNDSDGNSNWSTSIRASGAVASEAFVVLSDERIKNVVGVSDGKEDLKSLQGIEITDYKMKDSSRSSSSAVYKKVIAQQVEKVFPQAISKGKGVVPDIMKNGRIEDGWIALATDLKKGERVRLITDKQDTVYEVLEVKGGTFRTEFTTPGEDVFVYGREVNDLLTVDYDAISMLNVSATQQLKRDQDAEVKALRDENVALRAKIAEMEARDASLSSRMESIEKAMLTASESPTTTRVSFRRPAQAK